MTEGLGLVRDGAVLTITLDRQDAHNALDWKTREALVDALDEASADLAVRAVVLTGAGERAFCTGADLRVPAPGQTKKIAMLGSFDHHTGQLIVHTSPTKRSSDFVAHLEQLDRVGLHDRLGGWRLAIPPPRR